MDSYENVIWKIEVFSTDGDLEPEKTPHYVGHFESIERLHNYIGCLIFTNTDKFIVTPLTLSCSHETT